MKMLVTAALAAGMLVIASSPAFAAAQPTVFVDDDLIQCAQADYTSIQAAVDEAPPGTLVRVCPGHYEESVTVDKPLTLKGQPDAVQAIDCFDPAPSQLGDADAATQAILDGTSTPALILLDLDADDVRVEGFVLQGENGGMLAAAIAASGEHSGYTIRHNLIRLNSVGIQFGSSGASPSRFEHNCLRHNDWGLATDNRELANARIDHNRTYRTFNNAFEPANSNTRDVRLDHNHSRQDNFAYRILGNASDLQVASNTIESSRLGIVIGGGLPNPGLAIADNRILVDPALTVPFGGQQQGIAFTSPPSGVQPNAGTLVTGNVITAMRDGIVAAGPPMGATAALLDSHLTGNLTRDNLRDGIVLRGGNSGNIVRSNLAERNGRYGIYAQGAIGNHFEANQMTANLALDARDENRQANTWTANECATDYPEGTICGIGTMISP